MVNIKIKRVYDDPSEDDGYRILVDRLWPRGITKESARIDEWKGDIAPSTLLRKWFRHQPERFAEFEKHYRDELEINREELDRIKKMSLKKNICLLYAANDPEINHAKVLLDILNNE